MSLVGPRPCLPTRRSISPRTTSSASCAPPGITGLWQVTARAHASFAEALEMDVAYVRNWSLGLDLSLILRTPVEVLRQTEGDRLMAPLEQAQSASGRTRSQRTAPEARTPRCASGSSGSVTGGRTSFATSTSRPRRRPLGCAICGRSVLEALGRRFPAVRQTRDLDEMLDDDSVDAVAVVTPVSTHHDLAMRALKAGKHVFVEKPLAPSSDLAIDLIRAADERGLVLMPGHTFLYSPPVNRIRELIRSGELGEIYFISMSRVNLGLHQSDVSVIWDLGPHDFSILLYWLGERPSQVISMGRACIDGGKEDVAFITASSTPGRSLTSNCRGSPPASFAERPWWGRRRWSFTTTAATSRCACTTPA